MPLAFGFHGGSEWFLILLIVLILFGAKRLPDMAKSLGQGIKEFKKAMREVGDEGNNATTTTSSKPATDATSNGEERKLAPPATASSNNNPSKTT